MELIGIYHSHPHGPDEPSPTDVNEAYYPEAIHLIWSQRTGKWQCRAFMITERLSVGIPLVVVNQSLPMES
jgi:proteasome lid subunit RPN8/RPN11